MNTKRLNMLSCLFRIEKIIKRKTNNRAAASSAPGCEPGLGLPAAVNTVPRRGVFGRVSVGPAARLAAGFGAQKKRGSDSSSPRPSLKSFHYVSSSRPLGEDVCDGLRRLWTRTRLGRRLRGVQPAKVQREDSTAHPAAGRGDGRLPGGHDGHHFDQGE